MKLPLKGCKKAPVKLGPFKVADWCVTHNRKWNHDGKKRNATRKAIVNGQGFVGGAMGSFMAGAAGGFVAGKKYEEYKRREGEPGSPHRHRE